MIYSPAMDYKERDHVGFEYPFGDGVPRTVQLTKDVQATVFYNVNAKAKILARKDEKYQAWTNSYGAVSAVFNDGRKLGLLPDEYIVTQWHNSASIAAAQAMRLKEENEQ